MVLYWFLMVSDGFILVSNGFTMVSDGIDEAFFFVKQICFYKSLFSIQSF